MFKYACRYVGIDDPKRQRTLPIDAVNRGKAQEEIQTVANLYNNFIECRAVDDTYLIPASALDDRLDAKSYEPTGRMLPQWTRDGIQTELLRNIMEPVVPTVEDRIDASSPDEEVTYLVVGYDGFAREGETILLGEQKSVPNLIRVHSDQIVISHINAVNGSICVVPEELDGMVVTTEFTAFRTRDGYDPRVVWALLRSPEIRSEFLIRASGAGRTRVKWATIADIRVPIPSIELATAVVTDLLQAEESLRAAQLLRQEVQSRI